MSSMELDRTASSEANAARAAGIETANLEMNTSEVDELVDYNEEEDTDEEDLEAQMKELERTALKEMLPNQQWTCVERNSQI
jgi:hypothetical protein